MIVTAERNPDRQSISKFLMSSLMSSTGPFPEHLLPSNMFESRNAPVLWVGSGLSKRFVEGYPTWDELLERIAFRAGFDWNSFPAVKLRAKDRIDPNAKEDEVAAETATLLSELLTDRFIKREADPKEVLGEEGALRYMHGSDPVKLLVCSELKDVVLRSDMKEEIDEFRKLVDIVPAVVTTNYDTVIETLFNDRFAVYDSTDDYYGAPDVGIGEIHKLHGTVRRPDSIVLNTRDYKQMEPRSHVIVSKVISLMCESPLLIIGCSMRDWIVREVLRGMISSFSKEKAMEMCRNIVYVDYNPEWGPCQGTMDIGYGTGWLTVRTITTGDFLPIFRDLASYEQGIPVTRMRRLRKLLVNATSLNVPKDQRRLAYFGIEGIDDVDPNRTVVALTTDRALGAVKSYSTYKIEDIVADVLYEHRIDPANLIDVWFENSSTQRTAFIPVFDYLLKLDRGDMVTDKMAVFIAEKKVQFESHFKNLEKLHRMVRDRSTFNERMEAPLQFSRPELIAFAYHKGILDRDDATDLLRIQHRNMIGSEEKIGTDLKMAVTYLGYKTYLENNE